MGDCRYGVSTGIGQSSSDEIWASECAVRIGAGWRAILSGSVSDSTEEFSSSAKDSESE
jgi:hypothetical protein